MKLNIILYLLLFLGHAKVYQQLFIDTFSVDGSLADDPIYNAIPASDTTVQPFPEKIGGEACSDVDTTWFWVGLPISPFSFLGGVSYSSHLILTQAGDSYGMTICVDFGCYVCKFTNLITTQTIEWITYGNPDQHVTYSPEAFGSDASFEFTVRLDIYHHHWIVHVENHQGDFLYEKHFYPDLFDNLTYNCLGGVLEPYQCVDQIEFGQWICTSPDSLTLFIDEYEDTTYRNLNTDPRYIHIPNGDNFFDLPVIEANSYVACSDSGNPAQSYFGVNSGLQDLQQAYLSGVIMRGSFNIETSSFDASLVGWVNSGGYEARFTVNSDNLQVSLQKKFNAQNICEFQCDDLTRIIDNTPVGHSYDVVITITKESFTRTDTKDLWFIEVYKDGNNITFWDGLFSVNWAIYNVLGAALHTYDSCLDYFQVDIKCTAEPCLEGTYITQYLDNFDTLEYVYFSDSTQYFPIPIDLPMPMIINKQACVNPDVTGPYSGRAYFAIDSGLHMLQQAYDEGIKFFGQFHPTIGMDLAFVMWVDSGGHEARFTTPTDDSLYLKIQNLFNSAEVFDFSDTIVSSGGPLLAESYFVEIILTKDMNNPTTGVDNWEVIVRIDSYDGTEIFHETYTPPAAIYNALGGALHESGSCFEDLKIEIPCQFQTILPIPRVADWTPAGGSGDPHLTTFDGVSYEFMGVGTYALIESPHFKVQQDFVDCPTIDNPPAGNISCTGKTYIGISEIFDQTGPYLITMDPIEPQVFMIDDKVLDLTGDFRMSIEENSEIFVEYELETKCMGVYHQEGLFYITSCPYHFIIRLSPQDILWTSGELRGLLGNNNGDPKDDFILYGADTPIIESQHNIAFYGLEQPEIVEFGNSYRVCCQHEMLEENQIYPSYCVPPIIGVSADIYYRLADVNDGIALVNNLPTAIDTFCQSLIEDKKIDDPNEVFYSRCSFDRYYTNNDELASSNIEHIKLLIAAGLETYDDGFELAPLLIIFGLILTIVMVITFCIRKKAAFCCREKGQSIWMCIAFFILCILTLLTIGGAFINRGYMLASDGACQLELDSNQITLHRSEIEGFIVQCPGDCTSNSLNGDALIMNYILYAAYVHTACILLVLIFWHIPMEKESKKHLILHYWIMLPSLIFGLLAAILYSSLRISVLDPTFDIEWCGQQMNFKNLESWGPAEILFFWMPAIIQSGVYLVRLIVLRLRDKLDDYEPGLPIEFQKVRKTAATVLASSGLTIPGMPVQGVLPRASAPDAHMMVGGTTGTSQTGETTTTTTGTGETTTQSPPVYTESEPGSESTKAV